LGETAVHRERWVGLAGGRSGSRVGHG
jgi:hypothetical protein